MAVIQLSNISLSFGDRDLLKGIDFTLTTESRIALTGANGCGKSTLMKIIHGSVIPDGGAVTGLKDLRIAYLPQSGIYFNSRETLKVELEKSYHREKELLSKMESLGAELGEVKGESRSTISKLHEYHELQETLDESGYYRRDAAIEQTCTGLGFARSDFHRQVSEFSGGWQMRIALAKTLLERPDILLLDEPTNYLDYEARVWLEKFLGDFKGGILLVSHDRYFLDTTVSEIAELFNGGIYRFRGNYSGYVKKRAVEMESLLREHRKQQEEIKKLNAFINRFRYNESRAPLVQSRIKQLEKMKPIEIPESLKEIHFNFPHPPRSGEITVSLEKVCKSYGTNAVLKDLDLEIIRGDRLVLVGPNGAGKSTLMRILSGVDTNFKGDLRYGSKVKTGYFSQEQADLLTAEHSVLTELEESVPRESYGELIPELRNMLGAFLFRGDDIYKPLSVLSGGEKSRLALLKLLLTPSNLLILDEPTNHLDMTSKNVLLGALKRFQGTLVFVSHDRYFIQSLAGKVLELGGGRSRFYHGDFEYYLWKKNDLEIAAEAKKNDIIPTGSQKSSGRENHESEKKRKGRLKKLRREEQVILAELERNEETRSELENSMADPEIYSVGAKVKEIQAKLSELEERDLHLSRRWEEIESELAEYSGEENQI